MAKNLLVKCGEETSPPVQRLLKKELGGLVHRNSRAILDLTY